jgi:hypothetical protein
VLRHHHRQVDLRPERSPNISYGPPSTSESQNPYPVLWSRLLYAL